MLNNPFTVISPEKLDAVTAEQLFVEMFSDFPQVRNPGNSLILGARGSGKSMMFRCLLPDVLMIKEKSKFEKLDFIAFHIPIKNTQLRITELERLDMHHASNLINEHFLTLNVLMLVLKALTTLPFELEFNDEKYKSYFENTYCRYLRLSGCKIKCEYMNTSIKGFFQSLYYHAEEMYAEFIEYIFSIDANFDVPAPPYNSSLLTFLRFLVPVLTGLKLLPGFPDVNIYLFIDDADNLNLTQTKIINTWLASRTQPEISLKVSAQFGKYKTNVASNGILVEAPHDYQEINISDLYTTSKSAYYNRVSEIVEKRLILAGIIDNKPEAYFPPYEKQENDIREEERRLRDIWQEQGRGHRPTDDALRYARPNFIRNLGGTKKSRSKYMYAGFNTLVHLSSGVIRYFLDAAALMFDSTIKEQGEEQAYNFIPYNIQNEVMRKKADGMLLSQFRSLENDEKALECEIGDVQRLQNLLLAMGHTFHDILISDRSERRVFSIALSNPPTKEINAVLDLGVRTGFLHLSTIGNKDGSGRTWLYIMNRCLAPHFILDPTGFAGYLFVTNDNLLNAMRTGKKLRDLNNEEEPEQLAIFEGGHYD